MIVYREFSLYCAHSVAAFGPNHKCAKKHGHTYRVRVSITANMGCGNITIPFEKLESIADSVRKNLDHTDLNESLQTENPTTELVAVTILKMFEDELSLPVTVEVRETDSSGVIAFTGDEF